MCDRGSGHSPHSFKSLSTSISPSNDPPTLRPHSLPPPSPLFLPSSLAHSLSLSTPLSPPCLRHLFIEASCQHTVTPTPQSSTISPFPIDKKHRSPHHRAACTTSGGYKLLQQTQIHSVITRAGQRVHRHITHSSNDHVDYMFAEFYSSLCDCGQIESWHTTPYDNTITIAVMMLL